MSKKIVNPMAEIFRCLAISVLFMFIGFLVGPRILPPTAVYYANKIVMFLMIGLLILALFSRKSIIPRSFSMNFVYAFTFIDGIIMYPLLQYYLQDLGSDLVITILIGTIVLFGVLSLISYKKEAGHYLGMGKILLSGLIALIVLSIVNMFIGGATFNIGISIIGVVIFSGYVLYDISLIKYEIESGALQERNDLSIHVLNLYLDFINILLDLLGIASSLDD
ncbi:Bax inhibitor-1 family protein [Clostridium sp. CCUG 7971]|uniref:Bax inhibitor-1/YccA family protein n=1 Tax=Clostridium sp. CCUG 7971 TaxID=2811414 RepID=UPI001ABAAAAA|nr:Bax inhibitor-1 family protein [Clostridium sp. CCUG 7971]MBO3443460.1 US12 family protein [Clostridium sp. CCUG 7971]